MADRLQTFKLTEILSSNPQTKTIVSLGTIEDKPALVTIYRTQIPDISDGFPIEEIKLIEKNDVYSWALATVTQNLEDSPAAKIDVIWPATETHIAKYRPSPPRLVTESPEMYEKVVKPYIETMVGDRLEWVRGILFRGAEADRVLIRDTDPETGFVLLPNSKWDGHSLDSLYLLVLVGREDLRTIRDLTTDHLPLLENIRTKVHAFVKERFGLESSQVKLYFHYQPSYYHLHVHVANIGLDQNDFGRSILLDNVVDTIKRGGFGNISYSIAQGHEIWSGFEKENYV